MSFKKKQYNQKDIIDINSACPIQTQEQLAIYLRKNFSLPANIFRAQLFQKYTQKLKQVSILKFYLLDNIFFKPVHDYLNLNNVHNVQLKKLMSSKQMKIFIETVLCKIKLFEELVLERMEKQLDQRIQVSERYWVLFHNSQNLNILRNKLIKQTKEKLFQHSLKLIELYDTKTKNSQKLRVSKSHPNYYATLEDNQFSLFVSEILLNQRQLIGKYKIEKFASAQKFKNTLTPIHSYHEFTQKILFLYNFAYQIITQHLKMFEPKKNSDQSKDSENEENQIQEQSKRQTKSQSGTIQNQKKSNNSSFSTDCSQRVKTPKSLNEKIIQKDIKYQVRQKFAKNIAIQRQLYARCLNCVQYFYSGFPVYTQRNHFSKCTILNSINMIKECPDIIRQVIGGMVNDGGGTILFGCKKVRFGFIPIGEYVKLKDQESLKSSFENLFKCIVPQSYQKLIEYKIDFIPLKQSPLDSDGQLLMNNFSHKIERSFILQHYIMRVKVTPKSQKQIFLCQIDKTVYFFTRQDGRSVDIKDESLYEEIKKRALRFTEFKNKQNFDRVEKQMGKEFLVKIIRKRRQPLQNLHEGPCLDTLTLSLNFVK